MLDDIGGKYWHVPYLDQTETLLSERNRVLMMDVHETGRKLSMVLPTHQVSISQTLALSVTQQAFLSQF